MSWIDTILPAIGGGGLTAGSIGAIATRVIKNIVGSAVEEKVKPVKDEVSAMRLKLATETGGNSNGLRQKVNEVDSKVDRVAEDVAFLKGAFTRKDPPA